MNHTNAFEDDLNINNDLNDDNGNSNGNDSETIDRGERDKSDKLDNFNVNRNRNLNIRCDNTDFEVINW